MSPFLVADALTPLVLASPLACCTPSHQSAQREKQDLARSPGLTGRCRWAGVPACLLITAPAICNCRLRATNQHSRVLPDSTLLESWSRGLQPAGWGRGPRPSAHPLCSQRLLLLPAGCSRPGSTLSNVTRPREQSVPFQPISGGAQQPGRPPHPPYGLKGSFRCIFKTRSQSAGTQGGKGWGGLLLAARLAAPGTRIRPERHSRVLYPRQGVGVCGIRGGERGPWRPRSRRRRR